MPPLAIRNAIRSNKAKQQRNKCYWCFKAFHSHFRPARVSHLARYPERRDYWDSRNLVAACPYCTTAHRNGVLCARSIVDAFGRAVAA
jgi:hypothetical protein